MQMQLRRQSQQINIYKSKLRGKMNISMFFERYAWKMIEFFKLSTVTGINFSFLPQGFLFCTLSFQKFFTSNR